MRHLIVTLFSLFSISLIGQKYPEATLAKDRIASFEQRKNLIAQSLVKNVKFRNIGPTIMSGRVVDLAVDPQNPTHFLCGLCFGGTLGNEK